jgi:nucleoside-diphosphate-sugar epimerase
LRGGHAVTDLTHVDDATSAIIAALEAPSSSGGIYNVSGGEPLSLKHVIERVCAHSGVTARWRPTSVKAALAGARVMEWACACFPGQPEPPITRYGIGVLAFSQTLNIQAARRALNWSPRVSFEQGLALTFGESVRGA